MAGYFKSHLRRYGREAIGLAFFLTWLYCTLFGCGLVTTAYVHWGLELIWEAAGLSATIAAAIGLLLAPRIRTSHMSAYTIGGAFAAVAGAILIWLGYFDHDLFWYTRIIGGACCGVAFVSGVLVWGTKLASYNEADIEFAVPASFALSFALYCLILLTKVSSGAVMAMDCAFPIIAIFFALRDQRPFGSQKLPPARTAERAELKDMASLFVLVAFLWFQIAYFRVISTPAGAGNRYWHFLVPFFCACLVALALFLFCIKLSRYVNFTLLFRWALPLTLLSYALLYMDYDDPTQRILAYTVNFIGMFGVQFGCWMAAPKYIRRTKDSAGILFLLLAAAEGLGIYVGCKTSMYLLDVMAESDFMTASMFIAAIVLFVAMAVGFNPRWLFNRLAPERDERENPEEQDGSGGAPSTLNVLFEEQARALQSAYGLTERETEVASLLLAGRSRPYIRDELFVSLNTVHAHARSILAKCGVHSQQELMDLARLGDAADENAVQRHSA